MVYVCSLGLRPNGVSGSFVDGITESKSQSVLFSVVPGDHSSTETSRLQILEVILATLWRGKARCWMNCWIVSFASICQSICASIVDRFGINLGPSLVPFSDSLFDL